MQNFPYEKWTAPRHSWVWSTINCYEDTYMARVTALIWLFADEIRHFDTIPKCDGQTDRQTSSSAMVTCSKQSNKLEANDVLPNILTAHRPPKGPKMPFLSLVTLTFDVWPSHSNSSDRGTKHLFCEFGANPFSDSRDISYTNNKVRDSAKKHNLTQFTACGNNDLE